MSPLVPLSSQTPSHAQCPQLPLSSSPPRKSLPMNLFARGTLPENVRPKAIFLVLPMLSCSSAPTLSNKGTFQAQSRPIMALFPRLLVRPHPSTPTFRLITSQRQLLAPVTPRGEALLGATCKGGETATQNSPPRLPFSPGPQQKQEQGRNQGTKQPFSSKEGETTADSRRGNAL
jgi:hypothetical protein